MELISTIPSFMLAASTILAAGVAIVIIVMVTVAGFREEGSALAGAAKGASIAFWAFILAALTMGPILYTPDSGGIPTPAFYVKYWIVFILEALVWLVVVIVNFTRGRRAIWLPAILALPLAYLVGAAWTAKTVELIVFVFQSGDITILPKILLILLLVVYVIVYFFLPYALIPLLNGVRDTLLKSRDRNDHSDKVTV